VSRNRKRVQRRQRTPRELIGRDLARVRIAPPSRRRLLAVLLAGSLVAGLSLAALRVDILRLRYALADAVEEEKRLFEEHRVATAHLEALRDPARLASLADTRGLTPPTRVIELAPAAREAGTRP